MARVDLALEVDAGDGPHPLGMPPARFLRDYWQKAPLLVRNAFPALQSPITAEDLAGLACEDGALARIVSHDRATDRWTVENGPFAEDSFPSRPDRDWTLLVQDVDKWDPDVRALLGHFGFLPGWRMDDIMVSFAAPGGSVGAHIDNYDVFLLQGIGHRRWQIDTRPDPDERYRDDVPLRLLREFHPDRDWVLAPGDMLYLPPGIPHHGIAEDACVTISIGLRAPSSAELVEHYAESLAFDADERIRYADPDLAPAADPHEIDEAALDRAVTALQRLQLREREQLGEWFGRFISGYRVAAGMAPAPEHAEGDDIATAIHAGESWPRHPYSRMAWRRLAGSATQAMLFANGHALRCGVADARLLCAARLADAALLSRLSANGRGVLQALADNGHFLRERAEP